MRSAVATEMTSVGSAVMNLDPGFDNVSVGSSTASSDGTLVTHINNGLGLGAANTASAQTTVGTDAVARTAPFGLPVTP